MQDSIDNSIDNCNEEEFFEEKLIEKLKNAEKEIANGQFTDADIVFAELREKYSY